MEYHPIVHIHDSLDSEAVRQNLFHLKMELRRNYNLSKYIIHHSINLFNEN